MKRILLTYCFIIFPLLLLANGVLFSGNSFPVEKRTSYTIFDEKRLPSFKDEITMSFEIQIKEFNTFGYIFSLKDQNTNNTFSLVFTYKSKTESVFQFNSEGKYNHHTIELPNDSINHRWIPINLTLNKKKEQIECSVFGKKKIINAKTGIQDEIRPLIIFGKHNFIVDVPTFALRNLRIYNNKQSFYFPLEESRGDIVHDYTGKAIGKINNPTWLINESYYWKNILETQKVGSCAINFDEQHIYIISKDSLTEHDLTCSSTNTYPFTNPNPLDIDLGMNFYDQNTNQFFLYEVNGIPCGQTTLARLDLKTRTWESLDKQSLPVQLHHHNNFYDSRRQKLFLFGGFGNQRYNNTFLSYDLQQHKIDTLEIKNAEIDPRFYSGLAHDGDSIIYLYGGIGNHSGIQSLGKKYYNDLYKINLHTLQVEKKWDFPLTEMQATGNSMVYSDKENALYALKYKEYDKNSFVQLYKIGINDETIQPVGDSIPFLSVSIKTTLFLYHSKMLDKLYCVIHECSASDTTKISAYELAFPPIPFSYFGAKESQENKTNKLPFILIITAIVMTIAWGIYKYQKRPKGTENKENSFIEEKEPEEVKEEVIAHKDIVKKNNCIHLFGNFTVYNSLGKDITYMFSTKIKYIFIYILTCEAEEGVLSSSLNNIFWADKEESKIKNLKGVTINHLRKILTEIDGISLIYKNKYFYLDIQDPCYCDYIHAMKLMQEKSHSRLVSILQRGRFMEGINEELFDYTKGRIEDVILNYLTGELLNDANDFSKSKVEICQTILAIDSLNELALSVLVKVYEHHKMKAQALEVYSFFIKEYKKVMDKDYPYTLEDLLEKETA